MNDISSIPLIIRGRLAPGKDQSREASRVGHVRLMAQ